MGDRRRQDAHLNSKYEDRGIFKTKVVEMRLDLTPALRRSSRGDLICIGTVSGAEVEVIFPGRRSADTKVLAKELAVVERARRQGGLARKTLPLAATGTWRARIVEEDGLEPKRIYQFMVAEWTFANSNGAEETFGEPPAT